MKTKKKAKRKPVRRKAKPPAIPRALDFEATKKFIETNLKLDEDFGGIEHKSERILFKPGADKLARFFNVYPETVLVREEKLATEGIDIVTTTKLIDAKTQKVVWNSSICSCNTTEPEYHYQWVRPACETCAGNGSLLSGGICQTCKGKGFKPAPAPRDAAESVEVGMAKLIPELNGGGIAIGWQWWERRERETVATQWNNVRQQAAKRSFVQAIRSYGCVSKFFTEDVNDWYDAKRRVEQMAQRATRRRNG